MHSAVSSGREKVVATLLELGVEVDAVNSGGQTPLHYAVSQLLGFCSCLDSRVPQAMRMRQPRGA